MPKQKTSSAAKKRFKVTGAGKLLRRHAMKSHNLEKKSAKRKRKFGSSQEKVSGTDAREVRRMLGLRKGRS
jgi:large subunit ribosomal protein L35